jgi:hypothetical protein
MKLPSQITGSRRVLCLLKAPLTAYMCLVTAGLLVWPLAGDAQEKEAVMAGESMTVHHKHKNRLAGQGSPYLLQHADNPVDWYPWGAETFELAKKLDEPKYVDQQGPCLLSFPRKRESTRSSRPRHP